MKKLLALLACCIALAFLVGSSCHPDPTMAELKTMEQQGIAEKKADKAAHDRLSKADIKRMSDIDNQIAVERRTIRTNDKKSGRMYKNALGIVHNDEQSKSVREGVYEKIAVINDDNARRRNEIRKLESKKAEILSQESASCFPGETFIQTNESKLKPIMQVQPGEMIMAFDIGSQTNVPRRVLETYKDTNNHYYLINSAIKATAYERFLTTNGWKKVMNLNKGDIIQTDQGLETIEN